MDELTRLLQEVDYSAHDLALRAGPQASRQIAPFARHEDLHVRDLAILCLKATGGKDAAAALVEALFDEDASNAAGAAGGLAANPDPTVFCELLAAYDRRPRSFILGEIALVIARMDLPESLPELRRRYLVEADPEALEGLMVALARLGDAEASDDFAVLLGKAAGLELRRLLERAELIGRPWLLDHLAPHLDDLTPVVRVGLEELPGRISALRICDLTVELAATLVGMIAPPPPLPFPVATGSQTNFSVEQRAVVGRYLLSVKSSAAASRKA
jgi:hypothetical protein